jgi:hypothetical protein
LKYPGPTLGALAIDSYRGSHDGYSYNYPNVVDAINHALKQCGADCTVVLTFQSTCAAFAADRDGVNGWGFASTKEQAQNTALSYCIHAQATRC